MAATKKRVKGLPASTKGATGSRAAAKKGIKGSPAAKKEIKKSLGVPKKGVKKSQVAVKKGVKGSAAAGKKGARAAGAKKRISGVWSDICEGFWVAVTHGGGSWGAGRQSKGGSCLSELGAKFDASSSVPLHLPQKQDPFPGAAPISWHKVKKFQRGRKSKLVSFGGQAGVDRVAGERGLGPG